MNDKVKSVEALKIPQQLEREIEVYEIRIADFEIERRELEKQLDIRKPLDMKAQNYNGMPAGCRVDTTMDKVYKDIELIDIRLNSLKRILEYKNKSKHEIEDKIKGFDSVISMVYEMKYISKKENNNKFTNHEIAAELGYSVDYINKICGKLKKIIE